jgi:hypothetical protein
MPYSPFYLEAFKTGLEKDKPDFKLAPDACTVLQDSFVWRERISRKKGYQKIGRLLRILTAQALGNTTGDPHAGNIKTVLTLEANAEIEQGSVTISVAAPNAEVFTEPATPDGTLVGDGGGTGTINYATGAYTLVSGAGWGAGQAITADFNYAPGLPSMGIGLRELPAINAEQTIAFDTKYVYFWDTVDQRFEEAGAGTTWSGSDSQFFSVSNYSSATVGDAVIVTNFNKGVSPDPIRYYNGAWANFLPAVDGVGNELHQCRFLVPYYGYLIALNTWEGATLGAAVNYPGRVRWSALGDAFAANAWRSDIAGQGGFLGDITSESIVSFALVRNTLVVGFEKSFWRLRFTGNGQFPFEWERVDGEFGVESPFSVVTGDISQVSVGSRGIVTCDGLNAKRIDEKIPDVVFDMHNENEGVQRVHGVRDYDKKLIYWTFPDKDTDRTFPDRVLVLNYDNMSWSFFKDSLTCFGVLQEFDDKRWSDFPSTKWEDAQFTWVDSSMQALYPDIIAGNQQGYIVRMQQLASNDPALAITVITPGTPVQLTIPNHNFTSGQCVRVTGILGTSNTLNNTSYQVQYVDDNNITLFDADDIPITLAGGSTYLGGGEVALLHDYRVRFKKFHFLKEGKSTELGYIDFLINQTDNGEFNVDIYADNNDTTPVNIGDSFFNTTVSTQFYDSDLSGQERLMHRFFSRMHVQFLQFELNLTTAQKLDDQIHDSDIEIYAITLWASTSGRIV